MLQEFPVLAQLHALKCYRNDIGVLQESAHSVIGVAQECYRNLHLQQNQALPTWENENPLWESQKSSMTLTSLLYGQKTGQKFTSMGNPKSSMTPLWESQKTSMTLTSLLYGWKHETCASSVSDLSSSDISLYRLDIGFRHFVIQADISLIQAFPVL